MTKNTACQSTLIQQFSSNMNHFRKCRHRNANICSEIPFSILVSKSSGHLMSGFPQMISFFRRRCCVPLLTSRFSHYLLYRSEEHTSELQSRFDLVCRLLL